MGEASRQVLLIFLAGVFATLAISLIAKILGKDWRHVPAELLKLRAPSAKDNLLHIECIFI
jgi:hypothetical protein